MSHVQTLSVSDDEDGMRLDRWFKLHFPQIQFGHLQKLLRTGQIRIDGGRAKTNSRLEAGQSIRIPPIAPSENIKTHKPADKPLSKADFEFVQSLVLYLDDDLIVLNKPPGLAVQGGTNTERHLDGLLEGLKFKYPERPRLVHRLDKDTSGVLLLARTRHIASALASTFKTKTVHKLYWALVNGVPRYEAGEITLPLIKQARQGQERVHIAERNTPDALTARTFYQTVDTAGQKFAWLALKPVTGRTHQLRVHCLGLGHPIVGDGKYGGSAAHPGGEIPRKLHLHASQLRLLHPGTRKPFEISAPLAKVMAKSWHLLQFDPDLDIADPFAAYS